MKFIRRLTVTTLIRRSTRVVAPAGSICPVCGREIVATHDVETPHTPIDDRRVLTSANELGTSGKKE
jgi:hypothetical protein